jgi:hypothetical protein
MSASLLSFVVAGLATYGIGILAAKTSATAETSA